jgi:hypothetical protein
MSNSFYAVKLSSGKYVAFNGAYARTHECDSPLDRMIAGFESADSAGHWLEVASLNDKMMRNELNLTDYYYDGAKVVRIEKTFIETELLTSEG